MVAIVGYGNTLRGEDGFGIHVVEKLEKLDIQNTKFIKVHSLTPELCLDLIGYEKIIFVDTTYAKDNHYALACTTSENTDLNLSHSISPKVIIELLDKLYGSTPSYEIFSMLSNEFDEIEYEDRYTLCIEKIVQFIK